MGQALYRKYRSKKLSEVIGQEHITRTLDNALKTGKVSHAYLFTGPRGVGKTSVARILAHEINGLSYTDESMHLDIIEIDAASNRRIDEIRDLRDKVHVAPTSAKYKVYIIDEVHMLTREAFNALLKTLEEPPAHVIFILATTELHKLPETIISRTQRFTFKPIDDVEAVKHLRAIAKSENIDIDDDALALLVAHGQGSFRDSISLLDQVGNSAGKITRSDAERLVGLAASSRIDALLLAAINGTPAEVLESIQKLIEDGVSPGQTAKQLAAEIRTRIINDTASPVLVDLLSDLLQINASSDPAASLEVVLLRANLSSSPRVEEIRDQKLETKTEESEAKSQELKIEEKPKEAAETKPAKQTTPNPASKAAPADWWGDVLIHIKAVNNTLYGVLRMAEARIENDVLHLSFGFSFHKKKAEDNVTQAKINEAIEKVTGKSFRINAVHDKKLTANQLSEATSPPEPQNEPATHTPDISSITNIFGGGEVLDS